MLPPVTRFTPVLPSHLRLPNADGGETAPCRITERHECLTPYVLDGVRLLKRVDGAFSLCIIAQTRDVE